jgi:hypothetical protein
MVRPPAARDNEREVVF